MSYELIWEPRGVVKRFFGHVDGNEVLRATTETEVDPRFDDLRFVINDFLACTGFAFPADAVEEMAAIDGAIAQINSKIKIAIVATLPDVIAAADAYATDPLTSYPTRTFSTIEDARRWLGLPA
jgi:hypothetical protein